MGIQLELANFDGKSVAVLESIKAARPCSSDLLHQLVEITGLDDRNMQAGATWLLRAYLQEGEHLSEAHVDRLAAVLPTTLDGFGRLHICPSMRFIRVPERHAEAFATFFRACLSSKNTFLRAWTPEGLWRLAEQHPGYAAEAQAVVATALSDVAPSVRARARRTLAEE